MGTRHYRFLSLTGISRKGNLVNGVWVPPPTLQINLEILLTLIPLSTFYRQIKKNN